MIDSRLTRIRSLATEAASIAAELRDEINPGTDDDHDLRIMGDYLHRVTSKTRALEARHE